MRMYVCVYVCIFICFNIMEMTCDHLGMLLAMLLTTGDY